MYHQLATRFGRNSHQISGREALDNEALYRHVPSVFAREAHDSRSDRYVYVPTIEIVEGLRKEGWFPFFAVQSVPRDGSRHGHAKHMLRLRRDDGLGKPEAAEVIIVNSHDGTSAYQMFAGMLRFVCTNSMIAGERFEEVRVPHTRLIGQYDNGVGFGQRRVLLVWNRLILPNGRSIVLERQPGTDAEGYAGLEDGVDYHWGELFKAAALSTLLSIGANTGSSSDESDLLSAIRDGASDSIGQTGRQIVQRQLNIAPTLTIRPGFPVRVIVTRDLVLEPYGATP